MTLASAPVESLATCPEAAALDCSVDCAALSLLRRGLFLSPDSFVLVF